jgi:peptidoglycan hydrolase-like protein with peptidoglycan-binding domain
MMGRARKAVIAVAVVAAGGAAAAAAARFALGGGAAADQQPPSVLPPSTAEVTRQTLHDAKTVDGDLGYGATSTTTSRLAGTLTAVPDSGATVTRGQALYEVDGKPITLLYGQKPAYRALTLDTAGPDVRQLEENLKALGYSGFTVDDKYTSATETAVKRWQEDLGLDENGAVELGRVVFAPDAVRVDARAAGPGDPVAPGARVLTYTGTAKAVTVELEAADQRLATGGAAVTVTLPDNTAVPGRVDRVSTVIQPASNPNEDPTTTVEVIVGLADQKPAEAYALAAVDVTFTAAERPNVLTVPVAALVALPEGGFGVEVVVGTGTRYVPVRTGLFAGGRVEISGDGITEGMTVGMPK